MTEHFYDAIGMPLAIDEARVPVVSDYEATWLASHDADTSRFIIRYGYTAPPLDTGLGVTIEHYLKVQQPVDVRYAGLNAPELGTPEGKAALDWLNGRLGATSKVRLRTIDNRHDKYGRLLAWVFVDGACLNVDLVVSGHAVAYGDLPFSPPATTFTPPGWSPTIGGPPLHAGTIER